MRTAHSTFVKETEDFTCQLLTPEGLTFASPKGIGASWFSGLDYGPAIRMIAEGYEEGDVGITSDPYSGYVATHAPDTHLWKPVFHEGELVCFVGCHVHNTDVGGAVPASLSRSLTLAQDNVNRLAPLAARNIVPQTELSNAQREVVDLQGRIAAAREQQGRAMAAVREALSQASEAEFSFRQEALNERSQVEQKIAVNEESLRGARGMELRSPVDGVDNYVQVTTIGGFVQAGEKVMEVVPMGDKLLVETRVKPSDIAFIKVGDKALVKVTAYDFSTYGGLDGRVVQVSADSIYDEVERQAYFNVIVETQRSYLVAAGRKLPIAPGMMTDTQIITGRKSVLSYLLKPVLKARSDALRER